MTSIEKLDTDLNMKKPLKKISGFFVPCNGW